MSGFGGGDAWSKDHDKILKHARDLGYDKTGVSLPSADAPKGTWIPAMDAFNSWKDSERAKPESQRWWVTRPWTADEGTSHHGESSGHSGGLLSPPPGSINRGPYPLPNEYFPLLTTDYVRPQAYDSGLNYTPNWIESGPFPGLLYQTGTQQYHEAFPMEQGILEYQPNRFGVGPVQFMGAFDGPMNVVPPEELFTEEEEEEEYDWSTDPEGRKQGDGGMPESSQTTSIGIGDVDVNPSITT